MSIPLHLYAFNTALEPAFYAVLTNAGIANPYSPRSTEELKTPFATLEIKIGQELRRFPVITSGGDHVLLPDYYSATVTIDMTTNRTDPKQVAIHDLWCSMIRVAMIDWGRTFSGKLLYHAIDEIREAGTSATIENGDKTDTSSISFGFTFHILPEAFPASI